MPTSGPIIWQLSQMWIGPTYAAGMFYYITYPGTDATRPSYYAVKALPPNMSGLPVPTTGVVVIGSYGSLTAAQSACQNDVNPPIPLAIHQQIGY